MGFDIEHVEDPDLMFQDGKAKDPKTGLMRYGPRTPIDEENHVNIRTGIIGSSQSISGTQKLFKDMRNHIFPERNEKRMHNPPFPGLGEGSPLNMSIKIQKRWRESFSHEDICEIKEINKKNERIERTLEIIKNKISLLYEKETPPDVVIISIPKKINDTCISPQAKKPKIQTSKSDFHNRIKLQGMKIGLPTQLIRPETLNGVGTQSKSNIAWNLAVGMLYKSQKGHPWKLAELEQDTCFAGISFYKEREGDGSNTRAAMAQVFLETGESFILRGDKLKEGGRGSQSHLTENDAKNITEKIVNHYNRIRGTDPERLVIHKSSNFWEEERQGIKKGASNIGKIDLIAIREKHPIRLFSKGDYPVIRGTLVSSPNKEEYYLYTVGYIPPLGTYPASRIPKPIIVKPDPELCDTPIQEICGEILSFTKLDWNTAHYCRKLPVTIEVSRSVGDILAESRAKDIDIDPHYYFYM